MVIILGTLKYHRLSRFKRPLVFENLDELGNAAVLFPVPLIAAVAGVPVPRDVVHLLVRAALVGDKHYGAVKLVEPTQVFVLLHVRKELHVGGSRPS